MLFLGDMDVSNISKDNKDNISKYKGYIFLFLWRSVLL